MSMGLIFLPSAQQNHRTSIYSNQFLLQFHIQKDTTVQSRKPSQMSMHLYKFQMTLDTSNRMPAKQATSDTASMLSTSTTSTITAMKAWIHKNDKPKHSKPVMTTQTNAEEKKLKAEARAVYFSMK